MVVRAGPIGTDSSVSRPRLFHVTTPAHVTLDLFVRPPVMCGSLRVITPGGRPPTAEEKEKKNESCAGQQFFPVPTNDGTAFEVVVGGLDHNLCSLTTGNHAACEREFATYNLFTIQADKVVFTAFPNGGLLEASGGVVVNDGHPEHCRDSVRFLIANGQAVEAY